MVCGSFREKVTPLALSILRVFVGYLMFRHGYGKISGGFEAGIQGFAGHLESMGVPFPLMSAYLAWAAEFLGGLGLMIGLLTPIAAFGIFFTMAVAVFHVHWDGGLMGDNGFKYPMTLMWIAFFFMVRGAGPISVDALFCKKK